MKPILQFLFLYILSLAQLQAQDTSPNNTYQTAETLMVQTYSCSSLTQGSLAGATNTNNMDYSSVCLEADYTDAVGPHRDVWYKVMVPSSGKITFRIPHLVDSTYYLAQTVAYTLADSELTEISCTNALNISNVDDEYTHSLTGLTQGTEIYLMVVSGSEVSDAAAYDDDPKHFTICAFDPDGTLETPTVPKPILSYYSNPVGNRLAIESPYQIRSLAIYDLAGREVLTKTPQKQKLWLDTYNLSSGVYLLKAQTDEGEQTVQLVKK